VLARFFTQILTLEEFHQAAKYPLLLLFHFQILTIALPKVMPARDPCQDPQCLCEHHLEDTEQQCLCILLFNLLHIDQLKPAGIYLARVLAPITTKPAQ